MPVPRWKLAALPIAVLGLATPLFASCRGGPDPETPGVPAASGVPVAGPVCEEMKTGDFSGLQFTGAAGLGENVKRLLVQAPRFSGLSLGIEKDLIAACTELGLAAGLGENELKAEPDAGQGAEKACNAAATKVAFMFRQAKDAKIILDLQVETPRCFVDVTAAKKCLADCGAPVTKGDLRAQCVGGEIDGACQGRCSGICFGDPGAGSGSCHAACSGKCDHDFRGACGGKCSGTCDGAPTRGPKKCAGVCDGSCSEKGEGVCAGRCDGQCSGDFEPRDPSKCPGVCVGTCSGEVRDPLCSGELTPPGVDPVCQAACAAASALTARCDLPLVRVAVRGGKPTRELERLLAGIQSAIPKIVRIQQGPAKRLPRAVEGLATAAVDWSNAYATAGPKPLACVRAGIDAAKEAANWIGLSARGTEAIAPAIKTDPPPQQKVEDE
jgi:hypothetical protein